MKVQVVYFTYTPVVSIYTPVVSKYTPVVSHEVDLFDN